MSRKPINANRKAVTTSMRLARFLAFRGLSHVVIQDLLQFVPDKPPAVSSGTFYDAGSIMNPRKWFHWPAQTRFVMVGQCPNGDGVAIDTEKEPGAIFYVAHELLDREQPIEGAITRVADSPSDYMQKLLDHDFQEDFWEARARRTSRRARPRQPNRTLRKSSRR